VGTSANKSGSKSTTTFVEVLKELEAGLGLEVMVDGGPTLLKKESTVVDLTRRIPVVIREGAIKTSEILQYLEFRN